MYQGQCCSLNAEPFTKAEQKPAGKAVASFVTHIIIDWINGTSHNTLPFSYRLPYIML